MMRIETQPDFDKEIAFKLAILLKRVVEPRGVEPLTS
jgi:hypothetical protein